MDENMNGSELYENYLGEYLEHYQIKGAKHGIRNYQNYDGSLTPAGRIRYGVGPPRDSKAAKAAKVAKAKKEKAAKAEAKAQKKAEQDAAKDLSKHENMMNYLREHPKKAYKYRMDLSQKDVDDLVKQVDFDRKLKDLKIQETQRGWDAVKRIADNTGTLNRLLTQSKGIYSIVAETNNMLIDAGKLNGSKMPTYGGGGGNQKPNNPQPTGQQPNQNPKP